MACSNLPIIKPKVLAVEGDDDKYFFDKFINLLRIFDVQTLVMRGRFPLSNKVKSVTKISGWNNVVSFGLVIDADADYPSALMSVQHALIAARLAVPSAALLPAGRRRRVTFFILPGLTMRGAIEDLCLSSVRSHPVMACVDAYFHCLQRININCPKISKAKVHVFLASKREPDKKLGQATQAGYWPLSSAVFDDVRQFLRLL